MEVKIRPGADPIFYNCNKRILECMNLPIVERDNADGSKSLIIPDNKDARWYWTFGVNVGKLYFCEIDQVKKELDQQLTNLSKPG